MSIHVLLNLLNELGKRDKMGGLPGGKSLLPNFPGGRSHFFLLSAPSLNTESSLLTYMISAKT